MRRKEEVEKRKEANTGSEYWKRILQANTGSRRYSVPEVVHFVGNIFYDKLGGYKGLCTINCRCMLVAVVCCTIPYPSMPGNVV